MLFVLMYSSSVVGEVYLLLKFVVCSVRFSRLSSSVRVLGGLSFVIMAISCTFLPVLKKSCKHKACVIDG